MSEARKYPDDQGLATQRQKDDVTRLVADLGIPQIIELIAVEAGLHGSVQEVSICERARKDLCACTDSGERA